MTDAVQATVVEQAREIAAAWSPPGAPASWRLTAETFRAIADDEILAGLAAAIPLDRLPPLLLSAAITFLVTRIDPQPLARYYPRPGGEQPPYDDGFGEALRDFGRAEGGALIDLCRTHRYQMNEVGRCADVMPVLGLIARDSGRPLSLIDLGTGAGLGLHVDRYRYRYTRADGDVHVLGDPQSPLEIACEVRGPVPVPLPDSMPAIVERIGVDVEPLDLDDSDVLAWLAACVPPEAGAVTRFARAAEVARANPARRVRGDINEVLDDLVTALPVDSIACLVDTYVHVFMPDEMLRQFSHQLDALSRRHDIEWISVDPLVPLGPHGRNSVQGLTVPGELVRRNAGQGAFGLVGRTSLRNERRTGELLAIAHPGGTWLEWRHHHS